MMYQQRLGRRVDQWNSSMAPSSCGCMCCSIQSGNSVVVISSCVIVPSTRVRACARVRVCGPGLCHFLVCQSSG